MARTLKLLGLALTGITVYAVLILEGFHGPGTPMGDLSLAYQTWVNNNVPYGLTAPWVYPFLALWPMLLANGANPGQLELPWLIGCGAVTVVVALLVAGLLNSRRAYAGMYYWFASLLCLGPVAISRLDTLSVIFAVLAVLAIVRHRTVEGSVWIAVGMWLKVWPAALALAAVTAAKRRGKVLGALLAANVGIVLVGLLIGGNQNIFSFLSGQANRGIQIEAPIAEFWLWPAVGHTPGFGINYSQELMTFQVVGPNTNLFALLISLGQLVALAITATLGWLGLRRGASSERVFFWASFTAVCDLIFFNKVGSPQYQTWLVVPIIYGLLTGVARVRVAGVMVLAVSFVTWLIYPVSYDALLASHAGATAILTFRNLLLLGALVYGNLGLQKLGNQRANDL